MKTGKTNIMQYAEVVVNLPLSGQIAGDRRTYHYHIPAELAGQIQPGHVVIVPFGRHTVQGVVLALSETSPVPETKPLQGVAWPEPLLSERQLSLARWLSETYLAPLAIILWHLLPPGIGHRARLSLSLVENIAPPPRLTPEQQRLWQLLAKKPQLLHKLPKALAAPAVWQPLLERKVIRRALDVPRQAPRLPHDLQVTLATDPDQIAYTLLHLGRPSKQADILVYLLTTADPLPSVQQVQEAVICGHGPLQALANKGWISIEKAQQLYLSPLNRIALTRHADALPAQAAKQAAILRLLAADPRPKPAEAFYKAGGSASALRTLKRRGVLLNYREPAHVLRHLDADACVEAIIALRGSDKYRRVLNALLGAGEPAWIGWLYAETGANRQILNTLEAAGLLKYVVRRRYRNPLADRVMAVEPFPALLPGQQKAWQAIKAALQERTVHTPKRLLLHGVTGSGKTELYLRATQLVLQQNGQALILVPEIGMAVQTVQRFAKRFPGQVYLWHGQLSAGERLDLWLRNQQSDAPIIVGTRSALFLPWPHLQLIVLDEEQDTAYKNKMAPRYHARAVAEQLAASANAVLLSGTASPDVTTFFRAGQGDYQLLTLPERVIVAGDGKAPVRTTRQLPPITVVDMRKELQAGNRSMFSRALQQGIAKVLAAGEQAILLLNRRGAATFVMCRDCGHVLKCDECDIPLSFHPDATKPGGGELICHYCGRHYPVPEHCPVCGSPRIRYFGGGTQRVEEEVRHMWPQARSLRLDRDSTRRKGAYWRILEQFQARQADILVGTQMVSKGLDMPFVTFVGVVSADTTLFLPDFSAAERTFQLLLQVAGRTGRSDRGGQVVIQSYQPDLYPIQTASRHDFSAFYQQELRWRRRSGYPPFNRLLALTYLHPQEQEAEREAHTLAQKLQRRLRFQSEPYQMIGPAPAFFSRLGGNYRWQIVLRGHNPASLLRNIPLTRGWRVDVDPVSLL